MTSIIEILQTVADLGGLPRPTSAINSQDNTARQLIAIANDRGQEMGRMFPWQSMIKVGSITLVAGDQQSLPDDCTELLTDTAYYAGMMQPLNGPISLQEWQRQTQMVTSSLRFSFLRTFNDNGNTGITVNPVAVGGEVVNFLYKSKNWLRPKFWSAGMSVKANSWCYSDATYWTCSTAGTAGSTAPTNANGGNDGNLIWVPHPGVLYDLIGEDTDEPLVQARILQKGILATFFERKGWAYEKIEAEYYQGMREIFAERNGGRSFNLFGSKSNLISTQNYRERDY